MGSVQHRGLFDQLVWLVWVYNKHVMSAVNVKLILIAYMHSMLCVSLWIQVWTGSTMNICRPKAHDCTLYYSPLSDPVWCYLLLVWQMDLFKVQKSVLLQWRSARSFGTTVRCRGHNCRTLIDFERGNTYANIQSRSPTFWFSLPLSPSVSVCVTVRQAWRLIVLQEMLSPHRLPACIL